MAIAAALRFYGIGQGLQHLPVQSERIFVQSAWEMVGAGDLDQRCFLYPGLFFYLLRIPMALVHRQGLPTPLAYLVARCVVAGFGVLNVPLTFAVGQRLKGERCGLLAAALTAVSPLEVATAHYIRPDVVLETLALLAFLVFYAQQRRDLLSGFAIGAATALKFTGVLLAPAYVVRRLSEGTASFRGMLAAGGVSVATFFLFTPYALLTPSRFLSGANAQLDYQYASASPGYGGALRFYAATVVEHLGPLGAALLLVGLWSTSRPWRHWSALVAYPTVVILVHSTATVLGDRFLLPAAFALSILAALGAEALWDRRFAGGVLFSLALLHSGYTSVGNDRWMGRPTPLDEVRDWIGAHVPPGSSVLTDEKHLVIDKAHYALLWTDGSFWRGDPLGWGDRLAAVNADVVVAEPHDPLVAGFQEVYRAPAFPGLALGLFVAPPDLRPRYAPLSLSRARLTASENETLLPALADGDHHTFWHTSSWQGPHTWIGVDFEEEICLGRVTVELRDHIGSSLRLLVRQKGGELWEAPFVEVDRDTTLAPPSQTLLSFPLQVAGIRIVPATKFHTRWAVRELVVDALASSGSSAPR
jgi:hypothetical protein